MLARNYRFTALNSCGQQIASSGIVITGRRWKFNSSGAVVFESSEAALYTSPSAINNAAYYVPSGSGIDNSTDLYVGGDFRFTLVAPASSAGDVTLYYEFSTDGGTTWPTNGNGIIVCTISASAATTYYKGFSV